VTRRSDDEKKLSEARLDARTHDMLDGKGLSPTGAVMDFDTGDSVPGSALCQGQSLGHGQSGARSSPDPRSAAV